MSGSFVSLFEGYLPPPTLNDLKAFGFAIGKSVRALVLLVVSEGTDVTETNDISSIPAIETLINGLIGGLSLLSFHSCLPSILSIVSFLNLLAYHI